MVPGVQLGITTLSNQQKSELLRFVVKTMVRIADL